MKNLEHFLNELNADVTVCRVTLQTLLIRTISADPSLAEERLQDLKTDVTGALARMETDPEDPGTLKSKQLANIRGQEFFEDLERLVSEVRNKRGESGRN